MRACSQSACRRRWGSWSGQRGRGLLALSVEVGLGVLRELLELEVDELRRSEGTLEPGPHGGPPRP